MSAAAVAKTVIKVSTLGSRITSKSIAPRGKKISTSAIKRGNWLDSFIGFFTERIGNFFRSINFEKIWGWCVAAFNTIWNFNWAATDEELDKQIQQAWLNVEERMFGILGRSFGYLVCGAVPGAIIASFNMPMAAFLMKELGDEAVDDMLQELGSFLQLAGRTALTSMVLKAYQSVRSLIKKAAKIPGLRQALGTLGVSGATIDNWGEEKGKQWSFASAFRNKIESIQSDRLRNNIEEFIDEFGDACIESGYALARGLDEYLGLDGVNKGVFNLFGTERQIEYTPNKDVPSETFTLRGRSEFIKQQMLDIANTSTIVDNRDIGLLLPSNGGWDDIPITENNGIEVEFHFINYEQPPYWTNERRSKVVRSKLSVPNCNRVKLSWENIHTVLSGNTASTRRVAFMKGNIRCEANMSNGRPLCVYADSETEGEAMLEKLCSFTDNTLVYPINVRSHRGTKKRAGYNLTTTSTRQYLSHIVVVNWAKLTKYEQQVTGSIVPSKATRKSQTVKLKMHYERKPGWWDNELKEAMSNQLSNV